MNLLCTAATLSTVKKGSSVEVQNQMTSQGSRGLVYKQRWAVGTLKVPSLLVLGKKCTDGSGIRFYFKKVVRYFVNTGTFCVKDAAVNAMFTAIMPSVKVIPGQNICDVNRLQSYLTFLD